MVYISSPSIIHIFTLISFPQFLILFLLQPYILIETLKIWYLLFHMIIFMMNQSIFSLISELGRCYISLKRIHVSHITILQLYKELSMLIFLLFGKEYAHIYFCFQIVFLYQIMLAEKIIFIILLLHQMMSYNESLLFFLANTTLQRMIMEFTTSSSNYPIKSSPVS